MKEINITKINGKFLGEFEKFVSAYLGDDGKIYYYQIGIEIVPRTRDQLLDHFKFVDIQLYLLVKNWVLFIERDYNLYKLLN